MVELIIAHRVPCTLHLLVNQRSQIAREPTAKSTIRRFTEKSACVRYASTSRTIAGKEKMMS
jgi:hypothetical protein